MRREVTSKPSSQTSSLTIKNPPLTGDINMGNKAWDNWQHAPMTWWQCQLNFGLLCATADHLQAKDSLLAGLYRFHVYYTTRRLLVEVKVALPGDKSYSWYENAYDARAYKRLCTEFGVAPSTDWRQKLDHGCQGLGSWSMYMEPSGAYRHAHYSDGPFFHPKDAIRHNRDISGAWMMFILDKSEGFTQVGMEHLNDSIRTYVWAILGVQAQTRSNILKARTGFDAQKQFLANVEDAIASPFNIPSSIARYQKRLQYASVPLHFVFGIGLYLAPSDMALHQGNVQGYNNEIVIAGAEAAIGHNPGINESEQIGKTSGNVLQRKNRSTSRDWSQGATEWQTPSCCCWPGGSCWPCCWSAESRTSATTRVWSRSCDKPQRRKNGSHSRRDRGWPSGALVGVSLASPLRPWGEVPPRWWPRPHVVSEPSRGLL